MAQIGTDIIESIQLVSPFVAPVAMTLLAFSPGLGTQSSSGARTITVSKNGTPLSQTGSVAALTTGGTVVTLTTPVSLAVGDVLTVAGSGGTGASNDVACLWLQRA